MDYIKIEGYKLHKTCGNRHSFVEFKKLFPKLKDAEKAYLAVGGAIPKAKKPKESDK